MSAASDRSFLRDLGVEPAAIPKPGLRAWSRRKVQWIAFSVFMGVFTAYGAWGLCRPQGMLRLTTELLGASVIVNDWFSGDAPFSQSLPQGRHAVLVRMPGYHSERFEVRLKARETRQVAVQLKRKTAGPPARAADDGIS